MVSSKLSVMIPELRSKSKLSSAGRIPSPVKSTAIIALTEVTGRSRLSFMSYTASDAMVMNVVDTPVARLIMRRISSLSVLESSNTTVALGSVVRRVPPVRGTDSVREPNTRLLWNVMRVSINVLMLTVSENCKVTVLFVRSRLKFSREGLILSGSYSSTARAMEGWISSLDIPAKSTTSEPRAEMKVVL